MQRPLFLAFDGGVHKTTELFEMEPGACEEDYRLDADCFNGEHAYLSLVCGRHVCYYNARETPEPKPGDGCPKCFPVV